MRRALVLSLILAATPASASAATLTTAEPCYQETSDIVLAGAGFTPLTKVSITRDGKPLATADTDANGAFVGRVATPALPAGTSERLYRLSATDALNVAGTQYRGTKVAVAYKPGAGNPRTLRVRFSVNGFGLVHTHAPVYLHYVDPDGKARRAVRLGSVRGTCGLIRRTKLRRLFPFDAKRGRWVLQFDTNRAYVRGTDRSKFPWVRRRVEVFSSRS